jgi:hypothetical protein
MNGTDTARSDDAARAAGYGAVYGVENSEDSRIEALKFVKLASTLGTLVTEPNRN